MILKKPEKFKKIAFFTDIHWGKKSNSKIHNQDCLDFVDWFCDLVRKDKEITHIGFLGDWYESRSAINIETLEYSRKGALKLDELGLPVMFVVGNHDLARRTTRDVHSVKIFDELKNFTVIDSPTVIDNILWSPFLFEEEYPALIQHNDLWAFAGHFEFRNFYITGYNTLSTHGPDHKLFYGPKKIFSGHFHKRQATDNVCYIGNAFPMDAGDSGDLDRGACIYKVLEDDLSFVNWPDCPSYEKVSLKEVLEKLDAGTLNFRPKTKVKCIIDTEITYLEAQTIKEEMIKTFELRDFVIEEDLALKQETIEDTKADDKVYASIDDFVTSQLKELEIPSKVNIDRDLLTQIYKDLPLDLAVDE